MNRNRLILWAEDDEDDRSLIVDVTKKLGVNHFIDFVETGEELLDALYSSLVDRRLPELIVLDNNMPVMTGSEALNHIIKHEELRAIPVAFFTTAKVGSELHGLQHHAEIFIKPSTYESFAQTIKRILQLLPKSGSWKSRN